MEEKVKNTFGEPADVRTTLYSEYSGEQYIPYTQSGKKESIPYLLIPRNSIKKCKVCRLTALI